MTEWFPQFLLVRPPFYVGALVLAAIVVALQWAANLPLGATGAAGGLVEWLRNWRTAPTWRAWFFAGIVGGAALFAGLSGAELTWAHGSFDSRFGDGLGLKAVLLLSGGVLIGFGARTAGGCTSGHGICGVSRGSKTSLVATAVFSLTAMAVAQILNFLFPAGGASG